MDSLSPRWPEDNGEETPGKLSTLKMERLLSRGITLEARDMKGDYPKDGFDQPGYCDLKVNLADLAQGRMNQTNCWYLSEVQFQFDPY